MGPYFIFPVPRITFKNGIKIAENPFRVGACLENYVVKIIKCDMDLFSHTIFLHTLLNLPYFLLFFQFNLGIKSIFFGLLKF